MASLLYNTTMIPHPVCQRIKIARKAAGLTQTKLAQRARLNPADIFNYETRVVPPLVKLQKIAKALRIDLVTLLNGQVSGR